MDIPNILDDKAVTGKDTSNKYATLLETNED